MGGVWVIHTTFRKLARFRINRIITTQLNTAGGLLHYPSYKSDATSNGIGPSERGREIELILARIGVFLKHPIPIFSKLVDDVFFYKNPQIPCKSLVL